MTTTTSNGMDLTRFEQLLRELREALVRSAGALEREERAAAEPSLGVPLHLAELGSESVAHDLNFERLESISREIREIDAALDRVRDGSYGVCEGCGGRIPGERLEAIPYATLCLACKKAEEAR